MTLKVIIISGGVASGKSELSRGLSVSYGYRLIKTSDLIRRLRPNVPPTRRAFQRAGNQLDNKTDHEWIAQELALELRGRTSDDPIVLDGVRKLKQIEAIQRSVGHRHVRHVHLFADEVICKQRYQTRGRRSDADISYDEVVKNQSERAVRKLTSIADIVVDTARFTIDDVLSHVSSRLNLTSRTSDQLVDVLVGGQIGSEGKGNIADYMSPEYDILMRVGGPNAGHIVYEEPPYTHISLPCGTRRSERAQLLIGPGAVINPHTLLKEIRDCQVEPGRLIVDENVALISQDDIDWELTNLKREIGSTAQGVGAAAARRILNRFRDERACKLAKDVGSVCAELVPYIGSTMERLEKAYVRRQRILLEGTQGTALSLYHGDYPSVTSRDTTVSGCLSEAGIGPRRVRRIVLVCRTLPIRVGGRSGNLSSEIDWDLVASRSGNDAQELKTREVGSRSGTPRRVSEFDWKLLRKACHLNTPTDIALTFVDYMDKSNAAAARFEQLSSDTINFIEAVEAVSGVPCSLIANKFDFKCVIDRRRW